MYWFNSLWYSIFNFTSDSLIFTTANIACFTKKKEEKKKSHHPLSLSRFLIIISCHLTEKRDGQKSRIVPASAATKVTCHYNCGRKTTVKKNAMSANYAMSAHYAYARVVCIMFPHKSFTWQMIKSQLFNC